MFRDYFKNFDWWLLATTIFLVSIGLLIFWGGIGYDKSQIFFEKQALFLAIGVLAMFLISFFDYRAFKTSSSLVVSLYVISVISLAAVLFFGSQIRGSVSWFKIGQFSIEPVEFVKIAVLILLAKFFTLRHAEIYRLSHILLSALYVGIPVVLILLQPDFGSAILIIALWVGVMFVSGIKKKHLVFLFFSATIAVSIMWFGVFADYQKARIISFMSPLSDPYGSGYNVIQSQIAIGAGSVLGAGLGQGSQTRLGFLPEAHTDFIFAATAEEFGLVGVLFILAGYGFLAIRILKIAGQSSNNFARLFCFGFVILIFSHFTINIGMNLGLMPVTGITLPFLSYGGSSLLSAFIAIGIIQSIRVRSFRVAGREV